MAIFPFSKRITNKITNPYATNEQWFLYIKDNKDFIISRSTLVLINPDAMNLYKYRLEEFLTDYGVNPNNAWIVIWLNQLGSNINFNNLTELIIPSDTVIDELLEEFRAYEATRSSK